MDLQTVILTAGIPTAMTGFFFWLLQRKLTERDKQKEEERKIRLAKQDEDEKRREDLQYVIIQSVNASIALSEATARAVQRIPDAHCNGDMEDALDYASKVKHEQKNFLTKQGLRKVLD